MNYIYVFASRNESIAFGDYLRSHGIENRVIATPRACMTGCGLSVKIMAMGLDRANYYLSAFPYKSTFKGVFSIEERGAHTIVSRVR